MGTISTAGRNKGFEINGEILPWGRVQNRVALLRAEHTSSGEELTLEQRMHLQESALELLIDRMLIVQSARGCGLTPHDSEVDTMLQRFAAKPDGSFGCRADFADDETRDDLRERMMVDRMLDSWRMRAARPKNDEIRRHYKEHKEHYWQPEQVHASHIVCPVEAGDDEQPARALAEDLRRRVLLGEDFGALAKRHSGCPEQDGDLGWFAHGLMVDDFDGAVFGTIAGELTPVFQTIFGFHFARVHARKPAGIAPLEEVRARIEHAMWMREQDRVVERELVALRSRASIKRLS